MLSPWHGIGLGVLVLPTTVGVVAVEIGEIVPGTPIVAVVTDYARRGIGGIVGGIARGAPSP